MKSGYEVRGRVGVTSELVLTADWKTRRIARCTPDEDLEERRGNRGHGIHANKVDALLGPTRRRVVKKHECQYNLASVGRDGFWFERSSTLTSTVTIQWNIDD